MLTILDVHSYPSSHVAHKFNKTIGEFIEVGSVYKTDVLKELVAKICVDSVNLVEVVENSTKQLRVNLKIHLIVRYSEIN